MYSLSAGVVQAAVLVPWLEMQAQAALARSLLRLLIT
jgi:hypothetical protein